MKVSSSLFTAYALSDVTGHFCFVITCGLIVIFNKLNFVLLYNLSVHHKWSEVRQAAERIWKKCHKVGDVFLWISKDCRHGVLSKPTKFDTDGAADCSTGES